MTGATRSVVDEACTIEQTVMQEVDVYKPELPRAADKAEVALLVRPVDLGFVPLPET